jgi:hypothetical protein
MKVKGRNRLLLVGLVMLLAAPLVLILRDVARDVVVVPLLRILWVGRILYDSIPQLPLWALFLVMAVLIALRSLIKSKEPRQQVMKVQADHPGQIRVLTRWIQRAAEGEYFRWGLTRHLEGLILEVLAHRERVTPEQVRQHLRTGRLEVPPEIGAFLQVRTTLTFSRPTSLLSWLRHRLRLSTGHSSFDPDLERIVQFLEDQLEVQHDHRNRPGIRPD